jgi:predicted secreted Zn-dependent protease
MTTQRVEWIDYEVSGQTVEEVAASIQSAKDSKPELRTHDAYTAPDVILEQSEIGGGLVQSRAWLRVSVWLPRLAAGAPDDVAACFANYRTALEAHEALHVRGAELMFSKLHRWMTARTRSADEVREKILELKKDADARAAELDQRTGHGGPECRFPPPGCDQV